MMPGKLGVIVAALIAGISGSLSIFGYDTASVVTGYIAITACVAACVFMVVFNKQPPSVKKI